METATQEARSVLKEYFGYDRFRPRQEQIINAVLNKQDSLVLMPTGGGKSVCFQIPAIMSPGVALVISPLISLMKDQVEALNANNIPAAFYNSSLSVSEQAKVIQDVKSEKVKLLYVSPERLMTIAGSWLREVNLSLVAVDEAHCVSMWGHDFRPEYAQLKELRQQLANVPFVALTATADRTTRKDIIKQIGLNDPQTFISSFNRENLSLEVRANVRKKDKLKQISEFINARPNQAGIIYCLSRKGTEELAEGLEAAGIRARAYHAGLEPKLRSKIQENFINDKTPVICATIAFGMGIDKSNVRWVIHNNLPKNIEGYYQEIGRAGRDGAPADTILYYSLGDLRTLGKFASESAQSDILLEKLNRMQQYAEATTCRRKILLSYFSEHLAEDCGNCDVCQNPPKFIDGTILAQKALSALLRTGEKVGSQMLINILRGSKVQELLENGYDQIKTYGAGADLSQSDWQHYITQMLNLGVMEIAYDENFTLKASNFGRLILKGEQTLHLSSPSLARAAVQARANAVETPEDNLFERLRRLRLKIAKEMDVPAYVIFTDLTLREMASVQPITEEDMLQIQGVSKAKYYKYGVKFIIAIEKFQNRHLHTYQHSYELYKEGLQPEEIAVKRGISENTVFSHLAKMYQDGEAVDLKKYISDRELEAVKEAHQAINNPKSLKPYFEALNEEVSYGKIRIGLAILERE